MKISTVALIAIIASSFNFQGAFADPVASSSVVVNEPFMDRDGENALETGDYARAQNIYSSRLKNAGNDKTLLGYLHLGLGEAYLWQGDLKSAGNELKRASSLLKSATGDLKARTLDDLSFLNQYQGKLSDAVDLSEQTVEIRKADVVANPLAYVDASMHLVDLLDRSGQLDKARVVAQDALQVQLKQGENSNLVADLRERLGSLNRRLGNAQAANQYFQQSLQYKLNSSSLTKPYQPHAYWNNVTYRFVEGSPNSLQKFANGSAVEIVTANGVTMSAQVAAQSPAFATKCLQINLQIRNDTNSTIQFMPIAPTLTVMSPKSSVAQLIDPTKLASNVEKKGEKKAKWIKFWGENATTTLTSTMIGPGAGGYGPYGPYYGGFGGGYGGYGRYRNWNNSGDMTIINQQVPNYAAQAAALQKAANVTEQSQQAADNIRTSSLGATTINPGQTIGGSLYYDVAQFKQGILQIPVGNAFFEFEFPPR